MSIDGKCLDFWGIYEKDDIRKRVMHMEYYPEKSVIDLNPFFKDFFERRDDFLSMDVKDRHAEAVSHTTYNFTLIEFFETFIGTYQPKELADFIKKHILPDGPQSESFVKMVRNFNNNFYWCFLRAYERYGKHLNVAPVNLNLEKATKILSVLPKSTISPHHRGSFELRYSKGRRTDLKNRNLKTVEFYFYKNQRAKNKIRETLIKNKKPIILSKGHDGPELNYFALIDHYGLSRENLDIIRIK